MVDDIDAALAARAQQTEIEGRQRYGDETWVEYIAAIARQNPKGVPGDAVKVVLATEDPAAAFATIGRELLIGQADTDEAAARSYAKIREAERTAHKVSRGRVY